MIEMIKPVRVGILLGLITILFGMLWVMFIKTQHEFLHKVMSEASIEIEMPSFISTAHAGGTDDHSHDSGASNSESSMDSHSNKDNHHGSDSEPTEMSIDESVIAHGGPNHHAKSGEDLEALAHKRLVRGHIHAMGIGLLVIIVSLILATTIATEQVKFVTSTVLGVGGFLYPFSWIIMGLFTQSFGALEAESSVMLLVGPTVLMILGSIVTTIYYVYKTLFTGDIDDLVS